MKSNQLFFLLFLLGAVTHLHAGPVTSREACATTCDKDQTRFRFTPGKTYSFSYEAESVTRLNGASDELSGLHVKTNAKIHVLGACEFQLELEDTKLSHLSRVNASAKIPSAFKDEFKAALETRAVRFGMNNGKLESICGAAEEASWVLNIKRGIISALQNNLGSSQSETTLKETDVVGICDTDYRTMADGTILKTKNLLGCSEREYLNAMIQTMNFMAPSDVQGVPILKSELSCKQSIINGLVNKVDCEESHVVRPFSNGEAGAVTSLGMTMSLEKIISEVKIPKPITFVSSIPFDMRKNERELEDAERFIKAALAEVCVAGIAQDKSPARFANLIKNAQTLDAITLSKIRHELRDGNVCQLGRKTFHDVLPLVGTTAAVSVMKDILLAEEIESSEKEMWESAFAFIPHPTAAMIGHITQLLGEPNKKLYLSASSLVRSFCVRNAGCETVREVQDFMEILETNIGKDCALLEKDVVLMSLKAIGNAGVMISKPNTLITCVKNEKVSMDLRLASLEAFRHMTISSIKPALFKIYENFEQDPEIRIGAFVAFMRDPCKIGLDVIQSVMAKEKILQVGSFVISYINNAKRAHNPNSILQDFDTTKFKRDWNLESMKYSKAYRTSYFSSYLNMGIDAKSNVIFSPTGFLPKQVNTDLTVDLFGHKINLLEVGARMEGLEGILEHYFGPSGSLSSTGVGRTKRAALDAEKVRKIDEKVNSQTNIKSARGLIYLKMFGSELGYSELDLPSIIAKKDDINIFELLKSIANNHQTEYTQNFRLIDLTYTVPTVIGLPLKLDLNAHATVHLKIGGKLDIVNFFSTPRNMDIFGYIKPSAAIEVKTEMGIDAFFTQTGIKMIANLHTSTDIKGKIMLKDGQIFKVDYAVPETEQEIIHGMTKFFVRDSDGERELDMNTQDYISSTKCTDERLATITGLEMCGEIRLPAMGNNTPIFPLNGPVNIRLAITKKDQSLTGYTLEASRTSRDNVETVKLLFDTPGAHTYRQLSLESTLNIVERSVNFDLKTPWKKVNFAMDFTNKNDMDKVNAKIIIDEEIEYSVIASLTSHQEGQTIKISPEFVLKMNGIKPVIFEGAITIDKSKKIVGDLKVEMLNQAPIILVFSLQRVLGINKFSLYHDVTFTSPLLSFYSKGAFQKKAMRIVNHSEHSFRYRDGKEHKMTFNAKLHSQKRRDVHYVNVQTNVLLSDFPDHIISFALDYKKTGISRKFSVEGRFKRYLPPVKFAAEWTVQLNTPIHIAAKTEIILPSLTLAMEHELTEESSGSYKIVSVINWGEGQEAKIELVMDDLRTSDDIIRATLTGFIEAPMLPRIDIVLRPTLNKNNLVLFLEINHQATIYNIDIRLKKDGNAVTALCQVSLNGTKYDLDMKARKLLNNIEMDIDAKWNDKIYKININCAMENSAIWFQSKGNIEDLMFKLNFNGKITENAVRAHVEMEIGDKIVNSNLNILHNGMNIKIIVDADGLQHINSEISSFTLTLKNVKNGNDTSALIDIKVDQKPWLKVALKGSFTPDRISGNALINALGFTFTGDFALSYRTGAYHVWANLVLPTRIIRIEGSSTGINAKGVAKFLIDLNTNLEGNLFESETKWTMVSRKNDFQFNLDSILNTSASMLSSPIKITAFFGKDHIGTYKTDIAIDYGSKLGLKAVFQQAPIGIHTGIDIVTPFQNFEKLSADVVASLVENDLIFKFTAFQNENKLEMKLTVETQITETDFLNKVEISLVTPFKHFELITAVINNKISGFNIESNAEIKWATNQKVGFIFENEASVLNNIHGKLTVIIPVKEYETTSLDYSFVTNGGKTDVDIKLDLAAESYTFDGKADLSETLNKVVVIITTPGNPTGYKAEFELKLPQGGKKIEASFLVTLDKQRTIKISGYLNKEKWLSVAGKLTFSAFFADTYTLDFGWNIQTLEGQYSTMLLFKNEYGTMKYAVMMTLSNLLSAKKEARLIVEFPTLNRIEMEALINQNGQKLEIRTSITTTFPVLDKAAIAIDFEGDYMEFEGSVSITLPAIRTMEFHLSHKLDLTSGINHQGSVTVDCIFFSTTFITTNLDIKNNNEMKLVTDFQYGLRKGKLVIDAVLNRENLEGMENMSVTVKSTLIYKKKEIGSLSFFLENTNNALGYNCSMSIQQNFMNKLPTKLAAVLTIDVALEKTSIKFDSTADSIPLLNLDYSHIYSHVEGFEFASRSTLSLKSMKAATIVSISQPRGIMLIHVDAFQNDASIGVIDLSYELTSSNVHILKGKAVIDSETWLNVVLNLKIDLSDAFLSTQVIWKANPLIELLGQFKMEPLTAAIAIKYKGADLFESKNVLDIQKRQITLILNFDPILNMISPTTESWALHLEGSLVEKVDSCLIKIELGKGTQSIEIQVSVKKSGLDPSPEFSITNLHIQPGIFQLNFKVAAVNISNNFELLSTMDIKKSANLLKISFSNVFNDREYLKTSFEYKVINTVVTAKTELFLQPLDIDSLLFLQWQMQDSLVYKAMLIVDKKNAAKTTYTITGKVDIEDTKAIFEFKSIVPTRTMFFNVYHDHANANITQKVDFSWTTGKVIGYSLHLKKDPKEYPINYIWSGSLVYPIRTLKLNGSIELSWEKYHIDLNYFPDFSVPEKRAYLNVDINNNFDAIVNSNMNVELGHFSFESPLALQAMLTVGSGEILFAHSVSLDYSKAIQNKMSATFGLINQSGRSNVLRYLLMSEIKHQPSFIDVVTSTTFAKTAADEINLESKFAYLASNGDKKVVEVTVAKTNLPNDVVEIRLKTPNADRKITASLVHVSAEEDGHTHLTIEHSDVAKNTNATLFKMQFHETSRAVAIRLGLAESLLKINFDLHDKYLINLGIVARAKTLLLFKSNYKDAAHMLINTRIEWDTAPLVTLRKIFLPIFDLIKDDAIATWGPITTEIFQDLVKVKFPTIEKEILKMPGFFSNMWTQFVQAINSDVDIARESFNTMYEQNEFFLKDIAEAALKAIDYVEQTIRILYKEIEEKMMDQVKPMLTEIARINAEIKKFFQPYVTYCLTKIDVLAKFVVEQIESEIEAIIQLWADLVAFISAPLGERISSLGAAWANAKQYFDREMLRFDRVSVQILEFFAGLDAKKMEEAIAGLRDNLVAQYGGGGNSTMPAVLKAMVDHMERSIEAWKSYPTSQKWIRLVEFVVSDYEAARENVKTVLEALRKQMERIWLVVVSNKSAVLVWDKVNGVLEFDLEIPAIFADVKLPSIREIVDRMKKVNREMVWNIMDYYYYYKPRSTNILDLVPPFETIGIVAGDQHYFTFDGSHYEFAGDCSYVLARDFTNGKFTIVVNYRSTPSGPKRKSITVLAKNETIEIDTTSFHAFVDGKRARLPYRLEEATVTRTGVNEIAIVNEKKGISVVCNNGSRICVVSISGWSFGKTGGLLGTYDYEPYTDLTGPTGERLGDVASFANDWEVAKKCSDKTNRAKIYKLSTESRLCSALFKEDSSVLRPAFRIVDPTPFFNACVNDLEAANDANDNDDDIDYFPFTKPSVAAYVDTALHRAGIPLTFPDDAAM
jgi:hypothetical protein